jgi:hypothetical protein
LEKRESGLFFLNIGPRRGVYRKTSAYFGAAPEGNAVAARARNQGGREKMKLNLKGTLGLVVASCLALAGPALAAGNGHGIGAGSSIGASRGNSSFGLTQRTELRTGSGNSGFGRTTSANARLKSDDLDDQDEDRAPRTKKTKKAKHTWATYPGNSAFGRNQRINHLKGSGNNIYGKTTSANAKAKPKKNH